MTSIDFLQSWIETSHAAKGDMVIGAIPMLAEYKRYRQAAMRVEPARYAGHIRHKELRRPHFQSSEPEQELKRDKAMLPRSPEARLADRIDRPGQAPREAGA